MSFFHDFFGIVGDSGEQAVCCPFEHHTATGIPYLESRPSAHVNLSEGLFHCKACGAGHNEQSFIQKILGCDLVMARKLISCFKNDEDLNLWNKETLKVTQEHKLIQQLGISDELIEELHLADNKTNGIMFPVFMYNHLVDIRNYQPGGHPKVRSRAGCPSGLIIPFDVWRTTKLNKGTLLCAGEKDMLVARSRGFNAITLTGGEQTAPKLLEPFRDKIVWIVYDNDDAGKTGAIKAARTLYNVAKEVKIVTGFHEVCKENGEDITDFFIKYKKTKQDLINYIKAAEPYAPAPEDVEQHYPIVDLLTASRSDYVGKLVRSNIQVVATDEASFITPTTFIAEKLGNEGTIARGDTREWELTDNNIQDLLRLIDNNFKEETINQNIRDLLHIPLKEKEIKIMPYNKKTIHKAYVTDLFESISDEIVPMEYTAYTLGFKLESGKKYLVTYKIVPHPYKGQQLTMIITGATQASDSVSHFTLDEENKNLLKQIQNIAGTVPEKMQLLTQKVKGLLGYDGNDTLIQCLDLSYHTVLNFNFGSFKNERGYLDTLVVGESRVGKSSTANALRQTYGLGVFTSLAGNAATIPGLVGGSNKVGGNYQTRAGLIPQNHKGLIIFEEFGKSNNNIITELTDIRSSNEVRITRVSGTITMPAVVRMITLTNVKTSDGQIKPIASYPNGIAVVTELIGTAEDIARYDILLVLSDRGNSQIDPFWQPDEPFPKDVYQARIRWVWSRTADQVIISPEVGRYILAQANEMNKMYDSHIKIFGTEAWKKITRLSIAIAGYLVSTDESYENIIVQKEHVDYAIAFFIRIYDNPTFKLKEYVEHERQYSEIDDVGVSNLQDIFIKWGAAVLQLEQCTSISKAMLQASTGLNNDDINKLLATLLRNRFIRFNKNDILPTERFRLGLARINRNVRAQRVGEVDA